MRIRYLHDGRVMARLHSTAGPDVGDEVHFDGGEYVVARRVFEVKGTPFEVDTEMVVLLERLEGRETKEPG